MIFIARVGWRRGYRRHWLLHHVPIIIHLSKKFVFLNFLLLLFNHSVNVDIFFITVDATYQSDSTAMNHIKLEVLSSESILYLYVRDDHTFVHIFQKVGNSSGDINS